MRVLITGAAGFLGSHLAERFLTDGHSVVGIDNLLTGRKENIASLAGMPGFTFIEADVAVSIPDVGPVEGVLHLASPASPVDYYRFPIETLDVGANGTEHSLEIAEAHDARFLLASTSEVYGDPTVHPQPETYWGHVNPVGPRSVYDEAKRFAEALTMAYHRSRGVDTRIVRIFNTYGPRMRPQDGRVVSNFVVQALRGQPLTVYGDGSQSRSFCFVTDEVDGIYRLFHHTGPRAEEPVNIGNADEFTILELAELVRAAVARRTGITVAIDRLPLPADDPKQRQPDIRRASRMLGWRPEVTLREGLERTIDYFADVLHLTESAGRTLPGLAGQAAGATVNAEAAV